MTHAESLAQFVVRSSFDSLSSAADLQLKIRVLDALGCAIGALDGPPVSLIRKHLEDFGGRPLVTLIGGNKTSPDRAAFYNSALIRYLDFNDSYLAKGETGVTTKDFTRVRSPGRPLFRNLTNSASLMRQHSCSVKSRMRSRAWRTSKFLNS